MTRLAVLLLCTTHTPGKPKYDFFIVHLLTLSHAIRTLLPVVPKKYALPLCKSHWLFMVIVYIIEFRPEIRPSLIEDVDLKGRGWDDVIKKCLKMDKKEVHYIKAVRALRDAARLWKEDDKFFLKAAVKFTWEFEDWGEPSGSTEHN